MAWNKNANTAQRNFCDGKRRWSGKLYLYWGLALVFVPVPIIVFTSLVRSTSSVNKGSQMEARSASSQTCTLTIPRQKHDETVQRNHSVMAANDEPARMYLGHRVLKTVVSTNAENKIIHEKIWTDDGRTHSIYTEPPPIFKHASDNYLAMILCVDEGGELPPLPDFSDEKNLEEKFKESLLDPIEIHSDDDEEVKHTKEIIAIARESMKELLRQGRSFAEVLEEERRVFNDNHDIRSAIVSEYESMVRNADVSRDDAETYRTKMNEALSKMGIQEIEFKEKNSR